LLKKKSNAIGEKFDGDLAALPHQLLSSKQRDQMLFVKLDRDAVATRARSDGIARVCDPYWARISRRSRSPRLGSASTHEIKDYRLNDM